MKTKTFSGSSVLITGGTGSFGNAVLSRLLANDVAEVRIFSRDEKKQDDMRKRFRDSRLSFYIGDVRDRSSLIPATRGANFLFHAAALKQVPSCEFHPLEALKTNALGTENVLEVGIESGIQRVICLSTDKAVYPINAMGISKAMMEKITIAKSRNAAGTTICCTRYGNVMASRGSVIPLFVDQILKGEPITITDPNMTRFMMSLHDAVELVMYGFQHGLPGDVFVQKAPAATIKTLAVALCEIFGAVTHPINEIGTRHGEKLHEVLLSREEAGFAEDRGNYFRISADFRDMNYDKFIIQGERKALSDEDYNSNNTERLDVNSMKNMLMQLKFIKSKLASISGVNSS